MRAEPPRVVVNLPRPRWGTARSTTSPRPPHTSETPGPGGGGGSPTRRAAQHAGWARGPPLVDRPNEGALVGCGSVAAHSPGASCPGTWHRSRYTATGRRHPHRRHRSADQGRADHRRRHARTASQGRDDRGVGRGGARNVDRPARELRARTGPNRPDHHPTSLAAWTYGHLRHQIVDAS